MTNEKRGGRYAGRDGLPGMLWFGGWLFTSAYAQLVWWKILLGLVIWPYYLGNALR